MAITWERELESFLKIAKKKKKLQSNVLVWSLKPIVAQKSWSPYDMVRPRIFLPLRKGHRVLNFLSRCHHEPKLSLSRSTSASEVQTSNSEIAIFALRRFAKALKLNFLTSLSCRIWSHIISYVWILLICFFRFIASTCLRKCLWELILE